MGMESYFIHLIPEGVEPFRVDEGGGFASTGFRGKSLIEANTIVDKIVIGLAGKPVGKSHSQSKLVVDDAIETLIDDEDGFFQKATLVGCFAWYDEGLSTCYQISCVINNCIAVRVYYPEFVTLDDEEGFRQAIQMAYQSKYQEFLQTFEGIRAKVLPGKDFYEFYRQSKNPLRRVLRVIKSTWRR